MESGTLENVRLIDAGAYAEHKRDISSSGQYVNAFAGGLVGFMSGGTIKNCSITGSSSIYAIGKYASGSADAQAFAGGIVGYMTGGTVTGCSR